jgi:hypothetical protein
MVRAGLMIAAAALLTGCTAAGEGWTKPGADEASVRGAYRECHAIAAATVQPEIGINQDIAATRGVDWQRAQIRDVQATTMREATHDRLAKIVSSCMTANGFQPAP